MHQGCCNAFLPLSTNDHGAAVAKHGDATAAGKSGFPAVTTSDLTLQLCCFKLESVKLGPLVKAKAVVAVRRGQTPNNLYLLVQRLQTVLCAADQVRCDQYKICYVQKDFQRTNAKTAALRR